MPAKDTIPGFLARGFARATVRFYYGKLEITGRENIPSNGPVLFVANHANSLIDPVIIGITARRPVHFLTKAPLFQVPLFGGILRALGMLPAYRGTDDPSQVGANVKSLGEAASWLLRGECVGIFPEGKSHDALKVDKVRSGAARIAVQAFQQGAANLKIVPIGINYERKERFRSSAWVRVGEPISLEEWREQIAADERAAMRALTAEIDKRLKAVVIHLDEEQWEPFIGDLEALVPASGKRKRDAIAALRQHKWIADAVNYFAAVDRPRAEQIAAAILEHRRQLAAAGLSIHSDLFRLRYAKLFLRQCWELLFLLMGLIPALLGTLGNFVPLMLVRLAGLVLPKQNRTTVSLERLALGLPIFGAWHAWVWFRLADYFLPWVASVITALLLLSGIFALPFWGRAQRAFAVWVNELKMVFRKQELQRLRRGHIALRDRLVELAKDYHEAWPAGETSHIIPLWWWIGRRVLRWSMLLAAVAVVGFATAHFIEQRHVLLLRPGGLDFARMKTPVVERLLAEDEKTLAEMLAGLEALEKNALRLQRELVAGHRDFYSQADNDAIRQLLFAYFSYRNELLHLIWKYQNHKSAAEPPHQWRAFLLQLAAASALYESSFKLVTHFAQTPAAIRKLNEAEPLWEIPEGTYDMIRANLANVKTRRLWTDALSVYEKRMASAGPPPNEPEVFHQTIRRGSQISKRIEDMALGWTIGTTVDGMQKLGKSVLYRGQSIVSTWIGDTRVRKPREGKPLIQPEQLEELRKQLRPGDILIERQNWYLSRAFMPGYWAHAALYVGTTNDLAQMGLDRDPRVLRFWEEFAQRDAAGNEFVILEAVPRGVRMTTLERCIGVADSAAVLRPRIPPGQLPEVIAQAFVHLGKPYDFEFDFFSTDKLVCTELVYRSCGNAINLQLVEVLGHKTLPPTELVRKYVTERTSPNPDLEFVAFLDGEESQGKARFRDEASFAGTIHRPSLTWLQ